MKKKTWRVLLGILIASVLLVVGYVWIWIRASGYPLIDPTPKGEGSYEELDNLFSQFQTFYQTGNTDDLPTGYVRLTGLDNEDSEAKETWMIYYATASHRTTRGGTFVLMGSDGRIDGYFGHHCSKMDGGTVMMSANGYQFWNGWEFYESFNEVRDAFDASFKHERTEDVIGIRR